MVRYELHLSIRFYFHPAPIQAAYVSSINGGPICRSTAVYIQNADLIEFELWIMEQAKEKRVTGSHAIIIGGSGFSEF
jgi:hypothetical protein